MSKKNVGEWLLSQNRFEKGQSSSVSSKSAVTIAVTSGKGGVGKTSATLKMAKLMADKGFRTLVIDCDYNLSNTSVKLGLPISNDFYDLISANKVFNECLHKDGNFHLLSGCNGSIPLFENGVQMDSFIIDILLEHEKEFDVIFLDCPAGITKEVLTLNAYCDHRVVVVTPDKSSVTDSYSLLKILKNKYGISDNHVLFNKISDEKQFKRLVRTLSETVESFLSARISILGQVKKEDLSVDQFDNYLLKREKSSLHESFSKVVVKLSEECLGTIFSENGLRQDVQPQLS